MATEYWSSPNEVPLEYRTVTNSNFSCLANESAYLVEKGVRSLAYIGLHSVDNEVQISEIATRYDVNYMFTDIRLYDMDKSVYHKNLFIYKYSYQKHLLTYINEVDREDPFITDWLLGMMLGYPLLSIADYTSFYNFKKIPSPTMTVEQVKRLLMDYEMVTSKRFYMKDRKIIDKAIRDLNRNPVHTIVICTTADEAKYATEHYKNDLSISMTCVSSNKETFLFISPKNMMTVLLKRLFVLKDQTVVKYMIARLLGYSDSYLNRVMYS